ncbi:unnamed protein product [Blepharisma stoltei]|uniref:EF-hand domain-containing protein n=1 Tax=Blepharisma stoltei TaxID=1481888 RepID=A0AAU9J860_9CILI|nr:unnamed protein product [Blepharisma stoltei]
MGCGNSSISLVKKKKAEIEELKLQCAKDEEIIELRKHEIVLDEIEPGEKLEFLAYQEQLRARNFLQCLNHYVSHLPESTALLTESMSLANSTDLNRDFIQVRLKESVAENKYANMLNETLEELIVKNEKIRSKIHERIHDLENDMKHFPLLLEAINEIRENEDMLNEDPGDNLTILTNKLKERCDRLTQIEIIQRIFDYQGCIKYIKDKKEEITQLELKIEELTVEKEELKITCEGVKSGEIYFEPEEITWLNDKISQKETDILKYQQKIEDLLNSIEENKEIHKWKEDLLLKEIETKNKAEELKESIKTIEKEIQEISSKNKILFDLKKEEEKALQDQSNILLDIENHENAIQKSQLLISQQIKLMHQEISIRDLKILEARNELKLLEIEKKYEKEFTENKLKTFIISRLCQVQQKMPERAFKRWRWMTEVKWIEKEMEEIDDFEVVEQMDEGIFLKEEMLYWMNKNPILIALRDAGMDKEKPMTPLNLMKFLEDFMEKKYKSDLKDIGDRREPRQIAEFLLEHLQRVFGIQKLALRQLSQIIPSLKSLFDNGNQYATFYCRLLQLYHPSPVPYQLALFLTKARMIFAPLIEKYEKSVIFKNKNKTGKAKDNLDYIYAGGYAQISDAIDLIYTMFSNDRESGTQTLEHLKPPNVTDEEFVIYKICHRMSKLGKTPEGIFNILDRDGGGSIDCIEFVRGTYSALDLWISQSTIKKLFEKIDKDGSGDLSKDEFCKWISLKYMQDCNKSDRFLISKATFLTALIEVYMTRQKKDTLFLDKEVPKADAYEFDAFEDIIRTYSNTLTSQKLQAIYNDAKAICNDQPLNRNAIIRIMLRNGIGKYGLGPFILPEVAAIYTEDRPQKQTIFELMGYGERKSARKPTLRMSTINTGETKSPNRSPNSSFIMPSSLAGLASKAMSGKLSRDNSGESTPKAEFDTVTRRGALTLRSRESTPNQSFVFDSQHSTPKHSLNTTVTNSFSGLVRRNTRSSDNRGTTPKASMLEGLNRASERNLVAPSLQESFSEMVKSASGGLPPLRPSASEKARPSRIGAPQKKK